MLCGKGVDKEIDAMHQMCVIVT